jgi:thymidylate synthase
MSPHENPSPEKNQPKSASQSKIFHEEKQEQQQHDLPHETERKHYQSYDQRDYHKRLGFRCNQISKVLEKYLRRNLQSVVGSDADR